MQDGHRTYTCIFAKEGREREREGEREREREGERERERGAWTLVWGMGAPT